MRRTVFVPLYQPPLLNGKANGKSRAMIDLKEIALDGALLIGTSRIRTYFYDLLEMQGLAEKFAKVSSLSICHLK